MAASSSAPTRMRKGCQVRARAVGRNCPIRDRNGQADQIHSRTVVSDISAVSGDCSDGNIARR